MNDDIKFERDGKEYTLLVGVQENAFGHPGCVSTYFFKYATPDDLRAAGWHPLDELLHQAGLRTHWKRRAERAAAEGDQARAEVERLRSLLERGLNEGRNLVPTRLDGEASAIERACAAILMAFITGETE